MLWRVRTTLPDRPGALAALAAACGEAGVNILGLQIFPGVESVTDELVLGTPADWGEADVAELLGRSGGRTVSAGPCTEAALTDQPTRYVQAARGILAAPTSFPAVVARLFDAEPEPVPGPEADDVLGATDVMDLMDLMDMVVGDVRVQVRRRAPFTATEHARGAALAELVSDVLGRGRAGACVVDASRRVGRGATPDYAVDGRTVSALVEGATVGVATIGPEAVEPGVVPLALRVDAAWQRRGIGTRLLLHAARLAHADGAAEVLLRTRSDNPAVLPMVLAAGLRGRIRLSGETLTVRVPVRDLEPLRT